MEKHKQSELDTDEAWVASGGVTEPVQKPFGFEHNPNFWVKWGTIATALRELQVSPGTRVLDLGCGTGWTSRFLALAGYDVTGVDLTPGCLEAGRLHARRMGLELEYVQADMDELALGRRFGFALMFDSLHHTTRQATVVRRVAEHLEPGAWVLFGEPSWLHDYSPDARRVARELGWTERGVRLRQLRKDCRAAGFSRFRRFHEGCAPYERSVRGLAGQAARLLGAHVIAAPQISVWLAARRD